MTPDFEAARKWAGQDTSRWEDNNARACYLALLERENAANALLERAVADDSLRDGGLDDLAWEIRTHLEAKP